MIALGSYQGDAIRNITGYTDTYFNFNAVDGAFEHGNYTGGIQTVDNSKSGYHRLEFSASRVVPTAAENRPKSTSLNYYIYVY